MQHLFVGIRGQTGISRRYVCIRAVHERCSGSARLPALVAQRFVQSAAVAAAKLPGGLLQPSEGLATLQRLLDAAGQAGEAVETVCEELEVERFLEDFCDSLTNANAQDLRACLVAFARVQYMPPSVWPRLAAQLPRALAELPDMHVVHVALLMGSLQLRNMPVLLHEVADQLEQRASSLPPVGLVGSMIGLSQLGPWPDPVPGDAIVEHLSGASLETVPPNQLSACALAAATLGVADDAFWQLAHGIMATRVNQMGARNVADVLLALATTQRCPISLLEALQDRLPHVLDEVGPEDALTCAWGLCAMQLYPKTALPALLKKIHTDGLSDFTKMQVNQLMQVALTLQLEPSAAKVLEASPPAFHDHGVGDLWALAGETPRGACVVHDEVSELLNELDAGFSIDDTTAPGDFYMLDFVIRVPGAGSQSVIMLDDASGAEATMPQDPWVVLKRRHLARLGWDKVEWLPTRRWRIWSDDERRMFVSQLLQASD